MDIQTIVLYFVFHLHVRVTNSHKIMIGREKGRYGLIHMCFVCRYTLFTRMEKMNTLRHTQEK